MVDEHGATAGIVTRDDLLEELVGEIADEYDLPDETVHAVNDRTVQVAGTFPIDDFNTRFGVALPQTRFHTLAGVIFDQLGRVAVIGDELHVTGVRLRVIEVDGPRIRWLEARFPDRRSDQAPTSPTEGEGSPSRTPRSHTPVPGALPQAVTSHDDGYNGERSSVV